MKHEFAEVLNKTKILAPQQQTYGTVLSTIFSNQNNLCQMIANLRQEVKELKEDKENINLNPRNRINYRENKNNWLTIGATALKTRDSKVYGCPIANHQIVATFKNQMGGSQCGFDNPFLKNFLAKKKLWGRDTVNMIFNHKTNSDTNL